MKSSEPINSKPAVKAGIGRILITGGKGALAGPIARQLEGFGEVILTDLSDDPPVSETPAGYRQANLMDFKQVLGLMQGVDTVIHLAAVAAKLYLKGASLGPTELNGYHEDILRINPTIAYHVFEAARRAGVRRVIYASSLTIYFGDKERSFYTESDYPDPANLYSCTKLFGENLARVYHRDFGLDVLSLRIGQPYPCHAQHDYTWRTNRRARSTYVTLDDVGRAVASAVTTPEKFGVFNVVSDSDNPRFDLESSRRIGYVPSGRFTAEGLLHRDSEQEEWTMVSPTSAMLDEVSK